MPRSFVAKAGSKLGFITKEAGTAVDHLLQAAGRLSRRRRRLIWAVCLANLGFVGAYIASFYFGLSFVVLGPPACLIGIAAGLLLPSALTGEIQDEVDISFQRQLQMNIDLYETILERIGNIPAGSPRILRESLHQQLLTVSNELARLNPQLQPVPAPHVAEEEPKLLPAPEKDERSGH